MYYKVIKDGKVIDALSQLIFLKYQSKHDIMLTCDEGEAQAFLSSDRKYIWHTTALQPIPVDGYDTVILEEIDGYEYEKLKALNMQTAEEIIDEYTLSLINGGVL